MCITPRTTSAQHAELDTVKSVLGRIVLRISHRTMPMLSFNHCWSSARWVGGKDQKIRSLAGNEGGENQKPQQEENSVHRIILDGVHGANGR